MQGTSFYCALHNDPYIGPFQRSVKRLLQRTKSGWGELSIAPRTIAGREPALDPAQSHVESRHRGCEIRTIIALPHTHCRQVSCRRQLDGDGASPPAGRDVGRFEHPPHRTQQRASCAQRRHRVTPKFTPQNFEGRLMTLECVESPHQQIEQSVARPLIRLGGRRFGEHRLVDAPIEPAKDRLLRPEDAVDTQDRQPSCGCNCGKRHISPSLGRHLG